MGTNFYVRGHRHDDDPQWHIGKRSAAGMYCWDCRVTLCKDGEKGIHQGCSIRDHHDLCDCRWHKECPKCGGEPSREGVDSSSAGRELGFNKSLPASKSGVTTCGSFTWAMPFEDIPTALGGVTLCPCCGREYDDRDKVIEDEYGRLYSWHEFLMVLDECPVRYNDSIGQQFS